MSTIFGSSRVVLYIPPNYVTTDTDQSIYGLKTFNGLLTCEDGLDTNSITFNDGSTQITAYKQLPTGTYTYPQIVVDAQGGISSIVSTTPNYVTTNTTETITGVKTFSGLLTAGAGLSTSYIHFVDGSIQLTAYKKITSGTYSSPQIVVDSLGAISSIVSTSPVYVPVGTISMFGGSTPPTGYLLCNGASYDSTNPLYASLFAVIGYAYTPIALYTPPVFYVPDFRGVYPGMPGTNVLSKSQDGSLNTATFSGPSVLGIFQYQQVPLVPHTHTSNFPNNTDTAQSPGQESFYRSGSAQNNVTTTAINPSQPNGYTEVGNNVRPISLGINYIIKL